MFSISKLFSSVHEAESILKTRSLQP